MINFALLGAGRIGRMHAQNIVNNPKCNLVSVYDIDEENANDVAKFSGSKIVNSAEEAINDKNVIRTADEAGIAMIFTNTRHFKH